MINFNPVRFTGNLSFKKQAQSSAFSKVQYDSVSFTGNKKSENKKINEFDLRKSENVKKAANLSKKIATQKDLTLCSLQEAFNRTSPVEIEVMDIKDKPANIPIPSNTIAHMLPLYKTNSELHSAYIFLNPKYRTPEEKATLFADSMHEYTHVLQRSGDKTYYGMKEKFDNMEDIQMAARLSQGILNQLVSYYGNNVSNSPFFQRSAQNGKYQFSVEDVEQYSTKNKPAKEATEKIINDNLNSLYSIGNIGIEREKLESAVKGFIKQEALNEAEAYTVTLETLKEADSFNKITYLKRNINQGIYATIYNSMQ